MKKCIKILCLTVCISVSLLYPFQCQAGSIYTIKVPIDAKVSVKGALLTECNLISSEELSGRIHDIAYDITGKQNGFKYYSVVNLNDINDIIVYDSSMTPLKPREVGKDEKIIEYASFETNYGIKYSERIKGAAVAYHNRTGGYGNGSFYNYFLSGSDAAVKCELSDSGRKWGQFVTASNIEKTEIIKTVPYGDALFTSQVRVIANNPNAGYVEDYTINLLFQKSGNNFYVTNFTFMK